MTLNLTSLPQEVCSAVFLYLYNDDRAAFYALRSACRTCRALSEIFLFQEIEFNGEHEIEATLLERMRMPDQKIGENIRCLRLSWDRTTPSPSSAIRDTSKRFWGEPILESSTQQPSDSAAFRQWTGTLVECLNFLPNLSEIRWNSAYHIPSLLLVKISHRRNINLSYANHSRRGKHPLDKPLLSSLSLRSLDYTILASRPEASCSSEMAVLLECLLQARNLAVLKLQVQDTSWPPNNDYRDGPLNLPFRYGHEFPALKELSLDPVLQNYFPTPEHCRMWSSCMNWSHLLILDFGHGCPVHLLKALTGLVPQLQVLNLGFWHSYGAASDLWTLFEDPKVIERFLESIDALESVKLNCEDDSILRKLYSALLNKHGKSLKQLEVKFRALVAWEPETFSDLANRCLVLRSLRVPMKLQQVSSKEGQAWGFGRLFHAFWASRQISASALKALCQQEDVDVWPDMSSKRPTPPRATLAQPRKSSRTARLERFFSGPQTYTRGDYKQLRASMPSHGDAKDGPSTTPEFSPPVPSKASRHTPKHSVIPSIHTSLTSLHHLKHLHLEIQLSDSAPQFISGAPGYVQINNAFVTALLLRLWRDFGRNSAIEHIEVDFFAPEPSEKMWCYSVCEKAYLRADKIWETRVVVDVGEAGHDYKPGDFDPFRPTFGMQRWSNVHEESLHQGRRA